VLLFDRHLHALSSEYQNSKVIREYTLEMANDLLSIGLDPEKCVLFVQSDVKEHAELHLLLSMITPLPWVERVPTFKDMQKELVDKDINTYGYLGYPVLQTADIILYKAEIVPSARTRPPISSLPGRSPPFQPPFRPGLPRASNPADGDPPAGRHRRPEDEQVVRQCHLSQGRSRDHPGQDRADGDRHEAPAALRPRRAE